MLLNVGAFFESTLQKVTPQVTATIRFGRRTHYAENSQVFTALDSCRSLGILIHPYCVQ
tara:strand:+ start:15768 stop:15944 length:177 start_codon:yes stop_codon:yes gene_type:complete